MLLLVHLDVTYIHLRSYCFPYSTGWSWLLLTSRAGSEFIAWVAANYNYVYLATKFATFGSSIRLVAITNACVVCTIWNFILFPIIYFKSIPKGEKRTNFLKFNFGFFSKLLAVNMYMYHLC